MPSLPPPRLTELFYDGAWHDISGDMRESDPVTITRGVTALGTRADPTAASATLDNRSGDYSPRNPLSSLYGKIGRNTPWRFSVDAGAPWVDLPGTTDNAITTPYTSNLDITSDFDVRVDVALVDWATEQALAGRWVAASSRRSWALSISSTGLPQLRVTSGGTMGTASTLTGPAPVPAHAGQRIVLRATLDANNGASGKTATFYTGPGWEGPWTRIGDPVTTAGPVTIYSPSGVQLEAGSLPDLTAVPTRGRLYGMQLYSGLGNGAQLLVSVEVEPVAAVGGTTFTGPDGRTWTVRGAAALANRHTRMEGEIPAWPPSRDLSGADRTVRIAPAGIMRRLGSGTRPLDSALRRFIIANRPVECWPLTDGEQATQGAALFGSPPATSTGAVAPAWGKGSVGSWIEPTLLAAKDTDGQIEVRPPTLGATASWSVDFFRSGGGLFETLTIIDSGRGTDADPNTMWQLVFILATDQITVLRTVRTTDASSFTNLGNIPSPGIFDSRPHHIRMSTVVGSSSTGWIVYIDGVLVASGAESGTGRSVKLVGYSWGLGDEVSLGYLTYWGATAPTAPDIYEAFQGFPGETAGARVLRLSEENEVPITLAGLAETSTELGTQEPQRYLEALDTIAAADLGMVLEQRDARALVYRTRTTLYNQVPTLVLDFANGEVSAPFAPIDDDKLTENDVTVQRKNGASANAVRTDGPLSVDSIGRYDVAPELSLARDAQTTQQAYWRMNVGTFDGLRYTKITVDLGNERAYALVNDVLAVDVGALIRLQNLPADQQAGDVDLLVTGYDEEVGAAAWKVTFTCVPGEPWTVGVAEDRILGRADTAGSVLGSAVTASATSLPVTTTAGPRWVNTAEQSSEFPFDVTCGGEVMTVTDVTGQLGDRFERSVTAGWGTATSGQAWTTTGGSSSDYSVQGG
ncbi:hypothetical protein OG244_19395 [Streptomyces brevispora]|uniref:hypothetical protein n=1 Tax=Streptomyces brevispora TaxID=887462 RepID=UPI002E33F68C|nr:hypothetical protein [Streptomyces brevispora]